MCRHHGPTMAQRNCVLTHHGTKNTMKDCGLHQEIFRHAWGPVTHKVFALCQLNLSGKNLHKIG